MRLDTICETNTHSPLIYITIAKLFVYFYTFVCMESTDKSKLNCFCLCCCCNADCLNLISAAHWIVVEENSIDALIETSQHSIFTCSFLHLIYHSSTMVQHQSVQSHTHTHTRMRECTRAHLSKENAINVSYFSFFLILHTKYMCSNVQFPHKRIHKHTQFLFFSLSFALWLTFEQHKQLYPVCSPKKEM